MPGLTQQNPNSTATAAPSDQKDQKGSVAPALPQWCQELREVIVRSCRTKKFTCESDQKGEKCTIKFDQLIPANYFAFVLNGKPTDKNTKLFNLTKTNFLKWKNDRVFIFPIGISHYFTGTFQGCSSDSDSFRSHARVTFSFNDESTRDIAKLLSEGAVAVFPEVTETFKKEKLFCLKVRFVTEADQSGFTHKFALLQTFPVLWRDVHSHASLPVLSIQDKNLCIRFGSDNDASIFYQLIPREKGFEPQLNTNSIVIPAKGINIVFDAIKKLTKQLLLPCNFLTQIYLGDGNDVIARDPKVAPNLWYKDHLFHWNSVKLTKAHSRLKEVGLDRDALPNDWSKIPVKLQYLLISERIEASREEREYNNFYVEEKDEHAFKIVFDDNDAAQEFCNKFVPQCKVVPDSRATIIKKVVDKKPVPVPEVIITHQDSAAAKLAKLMQRHHRTLDISLPEQVDEVVHVKKYVLEISYADAFNLGCCLDLNMTAAEADKYVKLNKATPTAVVSAGDAATATATATAAATAGSDAKDDAVSASTSKGCVIA